MCAGGKVFCSPIGVADASTVDDAAREWQRVPEPGPSPRDCEAMSDESFLSNDTIPKATAEQRRRGKSMSRRSGQAGTIVKEGDWYRVRFRLDVPGQYQRVQRSIKICPVSGPGLLTKPERERRKVEIVNSFGANSVQHFNRVMAIEAGHTFRDQAKEWLHQCSIRRRKPIKPATICGWETYLSKHLNPIIGDALLSSVNNSTLKQLVTKLTDAGLSPKTIRNVVQVMTSVIASAVTDDGEQIYPRNWNYQFADVPIVGDQHTPTFTGKEVSKIIAEAEGQERAVFLLLAASGLRAGELFGLEVKHFAGTTTLSIEQALWRGRLQTPKTKNAYRQVDLHSSVAGFLRTFIGDRKKGFIFQSTDKTPIPVEFSAPVALPYSRKTWNRKAGISRLPPLPRDASRIKQRAACPREILDRTRQIE